MVGGGRGSLISRQDERYSGNKSRFKMASRSLAEEDAFDVRPLRKGPRSGYEHCNFDKLFLNLQCLYGYTTEAWKVWIMLLFSIMNLAKGALGGGVLAGHVSYMTAGYMAGIILNVVYGIYMGFNFYLVVISAQRLCKRCQLPDMTYPDAGEASFALFPNPKVARFSGCYRRWVDFITCVNLFGSCAAYQLMIAKSIKQLVEGSTMATLEGQNGHPHLRVYLAAMILPIVVICLITDIKYLAPFSTLANFVIAVVLIMTIRYAVKFNPGFENMVAFTNLYDQIKFTGMSVFSMSCAGVILPVENNMADPTKFVYVILIGYVFIIGSVFTASFFGYAAFLDKCTSPLTMNFPLTTVPMILKYGIVIMIYVTHGLNYFMPFNCVFYYIKPKFRPENQFKAELFFRALFVVIIGAFAIAFPNIDALMGFLGCFCLSNMAFICPNTIYVLVHYDRPGKNKSFMVCRAVCLSLFGVFILVCGSIVNGKEMVETLIESFRGTTTEATTTEAGAGL